MKLLFKLFVWIVIARWVHIEITAYSPETGQLIHSVFQTVQIPHHTKWPIYPQITALQKQISDEDIRIALQKLNQNLKEIPGVFRHESS